MMSTLTKVFALLCICAAVVQISAFSVFDPYMESQFPTSRVSSVGEDIYRTTADKRRSQLRNCYLSPVQCLLPVDNQRFSKFHKRLV